MPEWHDILHNDLALPDLLPEWVWRSNHLTSLLGQDVPPVVVWRALLAFSGLKYGTRSMGLWLASYVGGKNKITAGTVRGSRTHCYPKAADIAARSGASDRTVRQHLLELEQAGWLIITRHRRNPSDYWLGVPDVAACPCGCEESSAEEHAAQRPAQDTFTDISSAEVSAGQPAESTGQERQKLPIRAAETADALGSALGSDKGSFHSRSPAARSTPTPEPVSPVDELEQRITQMRRLRDRPTATPEERQHINGLIEELSSSRAAAS